MAGSRKEPEETEYVLKKGNITDIPVDSCKGWSEPCEYCDKRFCKWVSVDEEVYGKIPEKPGFFMIALKNKGITEVVSIIFHSSNIQKNAYDAMDKIKEQISNKKSKANKSEMFVRWMVIKKVEDKDNSVLCAHWYNYGILPKFISTWPGISLLENGDHLMLSKKLQKWCYPQKNPVWRKPKTPSSRILEEVKKCNLQNCEICDSNFSLWKNLEVYDSDTAPEENGIVMLSMVYGKCREIVSIAGGKCVKTAGGSKSVATIIKQEIKFMQSQRKFYLNHEKFKNKNARLEVRWMKLNSVDSDNSCFLFAHWLNADTLPIFNYYNYMPGKESLNQNKHFVIRESDKKWLYETETLKQIKFSKAKNRRQLYDQMVDDLDEEMF